MTGLAPNIAAIAEIIFFILVPVTAAFKLRRSALEVQRKRLLAGAMVFSVVAKIALAAMGHNFDVHAYRVVSDIIGQGRSVYANTNLYNYGPSWAWLVSGFGRLAGPDVGEGFHLWTAAFLACVDVIMALAIAEAYSWIAAMVYLLSPIGLLISGFHSQFDNVAVLLALLAWLLIRASKPKPTILIISSILMGLSLTVKHVMFLFPIWLVFWKPLGKLRYRMLYACIAYGLFAGSFLPWWADAASRIGIERNVFGYSSSFANSLLGAGIELFTPVRSLDPRVLGGFKALWMGLMIAAGMALARRGVRELYLFYLMFLYASSPALAVQYAAIPMLPAAVFYAAWESWAFLAAATIANLTSASNIGYLWYRTLPPLVIGGRPYAISDILNASAHPFFLVSSQFCIGALLVRNWLHLNRPPAASSLRLDLGKAAAMVPLGGLPMALALAKKAWQLLH
jgi:hypothetical protein